MAGRKPLRTSDAPRRARLSPWALRQFFAGCLLMLSVAGAFALVDHLRDAETLPVRSVQVDGNLLYQDRQQLMDAMLPHVTGGFFGVDLRQVERAVRDLPWVYAASVRRQWPDSLIVSVDEQVPLAYWGEDALLNHFGDVFRPDHVDIGLDLPKLTGRAGRELALIERFLEVHALLRTAGLEVTGISEDARRSWVIHLADGTRILMGRHTDMHRLDRLARNYSKIASHRQAPAERIDLRYTNGIAVAWSGSTREAVR